jgi:hypothetical protein
MMYDHNKRLITLTVIALSSFSNHTKCVFSMTFLLILKNPSSFFVKKERTTTLVLLPCFVPRVLSVDLYFFFFLSFIFSCFQHFILPSFINLSVFLYLDLHEEVLMYFFDNGVVPSCCSPSPPPPPKKQKQKSYFFSLATVKHRKIIIYKHTAFAIFVYI